jgi:hypothetical protein
MDTMNNICLAVSLDQQKNTPTAFHRRGRTYRVAEVQDCWRLVGDWWDGRGEKTFFRVIVSGGGIFELAYDHLRRTWHIERIED